MTLDEIIKLIREKTVLRWRLARWRLVACTYGNIVLFFREVHTSFYTSWGMLIKSMKQLVKYAAQSPTKCKVPRQTGNN